MKWKPISTALVLVFSFCLNSAALASSPTGTLPSTVVAANLSQPRLAKDVGPSLNELKRERKIILSGIVSLTGAIAEFSVAISTCSVNPLCGSSIAQLVAKQNALIQKLNQLKARLKKVDALIAILSVP